LIDEWMDEEDIYRVYNWSIKFINQIFDINRIEL